jgi:hypothetical protein
VRVCARVRGGGVERVVYVVWEKLGTGRMVSSCVFLFFSTVLGVVDDMWTSNLVCLYCRRWAMVLADSDFRAVPAIYVNSLLAVMYLTKLQHRMNHRPVCAGMAA